MNWPHWVLSRSDRREPAVRPEPPVRVGRVLLLALILSITVAPALAQDADPSATQRALSAANESSPVGLVSPAERQPGWKGWFADAWEGSKRIFQDGQSGLLLPFFTYHPPYNYPNRLQQNPYPWGAGFARTVIDSSDNERMVFLLAFSDSHYDVQPMLGYAWIARWPLVAGLKGGLGYAAFLTARADANYLPIPAALPLASIGTDRVALYGTWVPTADVLFFFARISLPFADEAAASGGGPAAGTRSGTVPAGSGPPRWNLVYGAAAWVNTDASGIDSVASGNSWAPLVGYRRFLSERAAVDVSVSRSSHSLDLNGARLGTFDMTPVTVAAQYHFPSYHGLRMYAGAGVAFNRIPQQDLPGYSLSNSSISPVLQAGVSYALTNALVITGGLSANFTRNQLSQNGATLGTVQLSPATFSLGLGFAF